MVRDIQINGECLVSVRGGAHLSGGPLGVLTELGLSADDVRIIPRFFHRDQAVAGFGPNVPAEVQWMLSEVYVRMSLVHYDKDALQVCVAEAMGGADITVSPIPGLTFSDGTLVGAGQSLGRYRPALASGCHYISLNLTSPVEQLPWRFPTVYLAESPVEYALGTKAQQVQLNWRVIPYVTPPRLSGSVPLLPSPAVEARWPVLTPTQASFVNEAELLCSGAILWDHVLET
jgi:hypothetical protein